MSQELLTAQEINQIKWRCRRGLLENDLFIERFFQAHETQLNRAQAQGLMTLMDLADNDLLDLLLARKEPDPEWGCADVRAVLSLMRQTQKH